MCFTRISEKKTAIFSLYSNNLPVFVIEAESVYSAVWTGPLNQINKISSFEG